MFIGEKEYYERQIATLKSFEEVDSIMDADSVVQDNDEEQAQQERAMKISNYANIALLILKVIFHLTFLYIRLSFTLESHVLKFEVATMFRFY